MNYQVVENPFVPMNESELLKNLEVSRKNATDGKMKNADEVVWTMKEKYLK